MSDRRKQLIDKLDGVLIAERRNSLSKWPYTPSRRVRRIEAYYRRHGITLPEHRGENHDTPTGSD